ncbi:MAG: TolC family protein [Phycisphaerae bacterium]|nr:TolC family protein [Gemmatimonadaceae bacterium]
MKRQAIRTFGVAVLTGAVLTAAPLVSGAQVAVGNRVGGSGDDGARSISLTEAVNLAQRNLPAAVQARNQERSASASMRAARGALIPSLSINASTNNRVGTQVSPVDGSLVRQGGNPWSYGNGMNLNLELFDGGRRFSEIRRNTFVAEAANVAVLTSRFDAALQAKQQFYAALAARESESAARAQLEQADQQLKASIARLSAGVITKSDSLRSIIQVGNAQLAILTAQNDLRVANATLTRITGSTELVTANPADTAYVAPPEITEAELLRTVPDAPAIQLAEANLSIAKAAKRTQKSAYLPTLSMSYGYSFSANSRSLTSGNLVLPFQGNATNKSLGFNFSYPIFNGFTRELNAVNTDIAVDNAEANLRDARLAARANLSTQLRTLNNANARIQVQLQSIAAAEEDLRVMQQRYQLGASTLLDLLTSQTQLNQARQALIQARFDARVAKAQLESLLGRDL